MAAAGAMLGAILSSKKGEKMDFERTEVKSARTKFFAVI